MSVLSTWNSEWQVTWTFYQHLSKQLPLFCTVSVLVDLWQVSDCHKHLPHWISQYAYLDIFNIAHTCTVAYSFVFNDVIMLQRFKYFNFSFKVPKVLFCAVLQLFHSNHLPSIILQWVISAHLNTAKVSLGHKWKHLGIKNKSTSFSLRVS